VLYNSLAISLASANRLDEALAAYHETTAIYDALGLGDGLDAQIIVANTGTLEFRAGHLREAEVLLNGSVERERSLAGDSAAVGAAMGYYGKVLCITNRVEPALAALREATDIAAHYAGANSPVALQNRLFLGEAQLAAGNRREAETTLRAVQEAALAQYGPNHALTLRAQIAVAQLAAAQGDYAEAQRQLQRSVETLRKVGAQSEPTLALALENMGDAQLHQEQIPQAKATLQEAVAIREKHPDDLWELAEARERLGEALAKGGSADAPAMLKQAAHDLELQLGADHPQTLRAKSALAQLRT
jgi:tetratricopeptide (TPR) repeat protein